MRKALLAVLAIILSGCHANPKFVCAPPKPAACPLPLCSAGTAQPASLTNLVLEGGGVKGLAYPGALQVLQARGILPEMNQVAGTSAGSIVRGADQRRRVNFFSAGGMEPCGRSMLQAISVPEQGGPSDMQSQVWY